MRNIRLAGASTASMVTYLVPLFAVLLGVLVLDEHLTWHQPVGALIVLLGVAISQGVLSRRRRPPPPPHPSTWPTPRTDSRPVRRPVPTRLPESRLAAGL